MDNDGELAISVTVNGSPRSARAPARRLLSDFLRHDLGLTGTHVGCEHGVCGACTILVDGKAVRSCLLFAPQAEGTEITTIEGLADGEKLHPLQEAFWEHHGLQCGFCTPGVLMSLAQFFRDHPGEHTDEELRRALSGTLCRCTGYVFMVDAARAAMRQQRGRDD